MENVYRNHQFDKVFDENCTILILGSFPSLKSIDKNFYYGHKQNRFWDILSLIYDVPNLKQYSNEEKTSFCLNNHIALYDVIDSCSIKGSSDLSIDKTSIVYTNIDDLINNSKINHIYLNGNKAYELFIKKFPHLKNISTKLPSTSPANAKMKLEDLIKMWQIIKN